MKTKLHSFRAIAALGAAVLAACACSNKGKVVQAQPATPATAAPAPSLPISRPAPVVRASPVASSSVVNPLTAASWTDIKDLTYEQRGDFLTGLGQLEGRLDAEVAALNAKRAAMTSDTKDWDFAMKGMLDAQAYLRSMPGEVSKTPPEMWIQEKEKVEAAWSSAQDAYDKVLHSTAAP